MSAVESLVVSSADVLRLYDPRVMPRMHLFSNFGTEESGDHFSLEELSAAFLLVLASVAEDFSMCDVAYMTPRCDHVADMVTEGLMQGDASYSERQYAEDLDIDAHQLWLMVCLLMIRSMHAHSDCTGAGPPVVSLINAPRLHAAVE